MWISVKLGVLITCVSLLRSLDRERLELVQPVQP